MTWLVLLLVQWPVLRLVMQLALWLALRLALRLALWLVLWEVLWLVRLGAEVTEAAAVVPAPRSLHLLLQQLLRRLLPALPAHLHANRHLC